MPGAYFLFALPSLPLSFFVSLCASVRHTVYLTGFLHCASYLYQALVVFTGREREGEKEAECQPHKVNTHTHMHIQWAQHLLTVVLPHLYILRQSWCTWTKRWANLPLAKLNLSQHAQPGPVPAHFAYGNTRAHTTAQCAQLEAVKYRTHTHTLADIFYIYHLSASVGLLRR